MSNGKITNNLHTNKDVTTVTRRVNIEGQPKMDTRTVSFLIMYLATIIVLVLEVQVLLVCLAAVSDEFDKSGNSHGSKTCCQDIITTAPSGTV